jgi:hypothetical protein
LQTIRDSRSPTLSHLKVLSATVTHYPLLCFMARMAALAASPEIQHRCGHTRSIRIKRTSGTCSCSVAHTAWREGVGRRPVRRPTHSIILTAVHPQQVSSCGKPVPGVVVLAESLARTLLFVQSNARATICTWAVEGFRTMAHWPSANIAVPVHQAQMPTILPRLAQPPRRRWLPFTALN